MDAAGDVEAGELFARVDRGELRREALELLAAVGDASARRALSRLDLVLTPTSAARPLEDLPPAFPDGWLEWAGGFACFDRRVGVVTALAVAREARFVLDAEPPHVRAELLGLHTGPGGVILIDESLANRVLPPSALADRVLEAATRWLEEPTEARASALDGEWPSLLRARAKVALLAELAEVSWPAVWSLRWLVASVCGPTADMAASVGYAATYAHAALGDRASISRAARDALREELIGSG